jgi:hypothetical protein
LQLLYLQVSPTSIFGDGLIGEAAAAMVAPVNTSIADIFRDHGPAWRQANAGHVSRDQLKVMTAIERCRTAALGGARRPCCALRERGVRLYGHLLQQLPYGQIQ